MKKGNKEESMKNGDATGDKKKGGRMIQENDTGNNRRDNNGCRNGKGKQQNTWRTTEKKTVKTNNQFEALKVRARGGSGHK